MQHDQSLSPKQRYDRKRYARIKKAKDRAKPADPMTRLPRERLAYIAGIVDGEGSIFVTAVGPHRRRTVYPTVVIAMTHRPVIDWLAEQLAAGTVKCHNQTNMRRHPTYKPQHRVQVFGKRAKLLCSLLLPYLLVKRPQAELVTTFPTEARLAPGARIAGSPVNELRYQLRDQINALNH